MIQRPNRSQKFHHILTYSRRVEDLSKSYKMRGFKIIFNPQAVRWESGVPFTLSNFLSNFTAHISYFNFKFVVWPLIGVIFVNYVIVKKSSKTFENSFLKNSIIDLWSEALIVSILTYSSNENFLLQRRLIMQQGLFFLLQFCSNFIFCCTLWMSLLGVSID